MAHEIAHVRNRDVRLMSLAAVLVGVIALVSDILMRITIYGGGGGRKRDDSGSGTIGALIGIAALILAPIGAALLQMCLSRQREFLADASAAEITGDPEGLAQALAKLRDDHQPLRKVTRATAHLYIESPLRDHKGRSLSSAGFFDTHPPSRSASRASPSSGASPSPEPGVPLRARSIRTTAWAAAPRARAPGEAEAVRARAADRDLRRLRAHRGRDALAHGVHVRRDPRRLQDDHAVR